MAKPVGPYSPAARAGDWLIVSGQIGVADGSLVDGGFEPELRQVLANLTGVLREHDARVDQVRKTMVFLTDMDDFGALNEIYVGTFGTENPPARAAIGVAALPLGAVVEIEAWAWLGD